MSTEKPRRRQDRLLRLVNRPESESVPFFDVQPYLPQGTRVEFVERAGFLANPHTINEFANKVIRKKNELVIFNCLLRYSLGFNRSFCRASNSFIAKWTGLDAANVRKGLRGLLDNGLVVVARPGTATLSTVFELPIVVGFLRFSQQQEAKQIDRGGIDLRANQPGANLPDPLGKSDLRTSVEATYKKEKPKENLETHTQQRSADTLEIEIYLQSVKPARKQESERFFFQSMRKDFNEADVLQGLRYLQAHGVLGTKEPCHSPMSYLARAGEDVILLAKAEAAKRQAREHAESDAVDRARTEKEREATEHAEHLLAIEQFQHTFAPAEQDERIEAFLSTNYPGSSFQLPRSVVLGFVARQWWDERTRQEMKEEQQ